MATIGNDAVGEERVAFGALSVADLLLDAGFVLMLAWHYLVLFSSVFGDLASGDVFGYLYMRQLVLYLSLAVTFGGIWLFARFRSKRGTARSASVMTIYLAGLLALVVSAVYASAVSAQLSDQVQLAIVALLGFSEGLLMYLWLHCFVEKRGERFSNPFAIDMVAGALLAFLICCFQWPVGPVATAIAPFVSSLVLAREKRLAGLAKSVKPSKAAKVEKTAKASAASDCDVEASGKGAHDLDAQKTVRGGGVHCKEGCERAQSVEDSRRRLVTRRNRQMTIFVAVYALVFGCMQGAFAVANASLLMANNTIALLGIALAGVVIACVPRAFGSLQRIDLIHRASLILFVLGAVVANCCMGAGTAVGGLFVVSQIALLAGFNLFDFGVLVYEITSRRAENGEEAEEGREQPVTDHSRPIVYLGLTGGLLISHALISTVPAAALPTALSLVCGASIVVLVTTVLIPFYNSNPAVEMPTCIGCTHLTLPALSVPPVDGALVAGAGAGGSVAGGAVPDDWESPWRRACNGIARQYQLSPRETEIFFMVAKGRNAEYIQQELVISTHTAKTHIANIYRKLDVHSSQELLDLVEEARGESSEDTPA